jgi:hypothetical protein
MVDNCQGGDSRRKGGIEDSGTTLRVGPVRANSEFVGTPPRGDGTPRPPPGASPNEEGREDTRGVPHTPPPPSDTRYGAPNAGEEEEEDKKDAVAYALAFVPGEEEDTMPFS